MMRGKDFPKYFIKPRGNEMEELHNMQKYVDPEDDEEYEKQDSIRTNEFREKSKEVLDNAYADYVPEENGDIFREIENGNFSRTGELTMLPSFIAEKIVNKKFTLISLPGVKILYKDAAKYLGDYEGRLFLSELRTLEYGVAEELGRHKGFLDLGRLELLSDEDAHFLGGQDGELRLVNLKSISDKGLQELARHLLPVELPSELQQKFDTYKQLNMRKKAS